MTEKHKLEKVRWGTLMPITTYRGCLVSKTKHGYSIFGKKADTPEEVDAIISNAEKSLENSIK